MRKTLTASASSLAVLALGAAFGLPAGAQDAAHQAGLSAYERLGDADAQWGFLNEYCVDCHNFEDWAGGVAFDVMSADGVPQDAEVWEASVRKLRGRLMPPGGEDQPDQAAVDSFVGWMEGYLDHAAEAETSPGYVAVHRLNRKEYANAVRDLLALEVDAESLLPPDPSVEGFDNMAEALMVTPSFLDQSLIAARTVAVQAVGNPTPRTAGAQYFAGGGGQQTHVEGLPLGTRGGVMVEHYFPADGEYMLNIANMAQALWVTNQEFTHTLIATYDGEKFLEMDIAGGEDLRSIDQDGDPAVDAINARLKNIPFEAKAGPHEIAVTFLHRSFAESEGILGSITPGGGQTNILRLGSFEILGPYNPTGLSDTPSREKIFICYPEQESEEAACADEIIRNLARRAYRRPATDADVAELRPLYEAGRAAGRFDDGIRRALTGVLANPKFLYRLEPTPEDVAPGENYRLSDLELASRLSFFLWSSVPDDELLTVAADGRLREPGVLEAQVRRMLADPRSESLASNFAYQWLHLVRLGEVDPDPEIFADVPGTLREDLRTETTMFVDSVFREDRNVTDLLTANYTYLNERLALHYGITDVRGDRFRRVELENPNRWGLLGKGAVLMLSSLPNRTAPVIRGQWILENVTGTPPAAPPPGVEAIKENVAGSGEFLSVAQQMELHRTDPACNSCHGVLDPLGMSLENFDAVGRWRTIDRFARTPIESGGVLPDGTELHNAVDLRNALMRKPDQFVQTLTEKLMTFAMGRPTEHHDMPTVRAIVRAAADDDNRFSDIVLGIVESDQFQRKAVPEASGEIEEAALHR